MGRVTGATNQQGNRVSLSLDADGRPRSVTDPNNLSTSYEYYHASQDGRLKKTTLPPISGQTQGRAVEVATYDGAGHPTKINALAADGAIRDSYRLYDELGRLTRDVGPQVSATDPNRPVTCLVYTSLGFVAEVWAGATTDTTSKVCNLADASLKKQVTSTYDDFGRKLTETDQNGKVWKWNWNPYNQLTSSQTPTQIAAGQSTVYSYGSKLNSGETQGQLKSRTVPGAQSAVYLRDALGFVTQAQARDGSNTLIVAYTYSYDPAKRLKSVTDSRGNKTLTYTWTPGGRLIEQRSNSGQSTTQSWFEDGSLKQKQNLFNATELSNHVYTIDNQGRRAGQTETIAVTAKTWSYLYDNQLAEIRNGGDAGALTRLTGSGCHGHKEPLAAALCGRV